MNKQVKINFRDKTSITLDLEVAEAILDSKDQLIKIYDTEGVWTGQSINKSEIVGTSRDFYEEHRSSSKDVPLLVGAKELTPEERKKKFEEYRPVRPYTDL